VAEPQTAAEVSAWYWGWRHTNGNSNTLADQLTVSAFYNFTGNINAAHKNESVREADYYRALGALYFGLQAHESVTQIGNQSISDLPSLLGALRSHNFKMGDRVTITVSNGSSTFTRTVIVGG
jgi:hypothetical protein